MTSTKQKEEASARATTVQTEAGDTPRMGRFRDLLWVVSACVLVLLAALLPLALNPRFYYYADTQDGAFGIWYELGQKLTHGEWPVFSTQAWMAGNYAAEGQWGLWNPVILGIGLLARGAGNVLVFSSVVKIAFMLLATVGTFLVARSYAARTELSFVAAVAAPLAGFTLFMDAPSWVTNLMVWALWPLTWWGLRRMVTKNASPLAALIFGYLLITIGYVHGTIMLVFLFVGLIVETFFSAQRHHVRRLLSKLVFAGIILGLVALTTYLPGVLSAGVTARASSIGNDGFMVANLTGLATAAVPTSLPQLTGWWGTFAKEPLLYIAWFLPLVAFVRWKAIGSTVKSHLALFSMLGVSLLFVIGPGQLGPLRYPARIMPFLTLTTLVLLAVLLSRHQARMTTGRLYAAFALVAFGAYLAFSQDPLHWRRHASTSLIAAAAIMLVWVLLKRGGPSGLIAIRTGSLGRGWFQSAAVIACGTLLMTGVQAHYFARDLQSNPNAPVNVSDYQTQLHGAVGDAFVVGTGSELGSEMFHDALIANTWYLNNAKVQNLYTPLQYKAYADDLCMTHRGETCSAALPKLFSVDAKTGKRVVDLLSLDTILVLRSPQQSLQDLLNMPVPSGWSREAKGTDSVTWTRDDPTPDAGGVVWSSPGVDVRQNVNEPQKLQLKINAVPESGGQIVLSRLNWPGYRLSSGTLDHPDRDYLVTVDLPAGSQGQTLDISFAPPGWDIEVAAIVLALVLIIAWVTVDALQRTRRRRREGPVE